MKQRRTEFRRGRCDNDESPVHPVNITRGYWIGRTEVTVAAYKRYTRETNSSMPPEPITFGNSINTNWPDDSMPISNVTWNEALDYCKGWPSASD